MGEMRQQLLGKPILDPETANNLLSSLLFPYFSYPYYFSQVITCSGFAIVSACYPEFGEYAAI